MVERGAVEAGVVEVNVELRVAEFSVVEFEGCMLLLARREGLILVVWWLRGGNLRSENGRQRGLLDVCSIELTRWEGSARSRGAKVESARRKIPAVRKSSPKASV